MASAKERYFFDFETTTKLDDCRVWCWGMYNIDTGDFEHGKDIDEYMRRIGLESSVGWFHNIKFDGMFIIDKLFRLGYTYDERASRPGTFSTIISSMGNMYGMKIHFFNGNKIELRDSAKKFPNMSIAKIAKSFNMEEGKGEIDYHADRPIGYEPTEEELDYLYRDCKIGGDAIAETLEMGMTKLTIGSDSLHEFKTITGKQNYIYQFPILAHEIDAEIRRAYRGGFTYADERFKGHLVGSGVVLDVNSLYPYIMATKLIPYGEPVFYDGKANTTNEYPLSIFSVTFTAKLKPRHIPCIQVKGSFRFNPVDYQKEISEPTTLMVTNVDWELYNEHYDIEVQEWGSGWLFHATIGMFDDYIDKWSAVKAESVGGKRELAKLHLNSLYGKMATNPRVTQKIATFDPEEDRIRLVMGEDELRPPVYTAAGVFITSHARAHTIRAAQDNYDRFAYADTDSLHLIDESIIPTLTGHIDRVPSLLEVHPTKLGAWDHEYSFEAAFYMRAKAYAEMKHDGSYVTRIAGLPTHLSAALRFSDLYDGNIVHGKLTPKIVPGGVVLVDTPYKLVVS